MPRFTIQIPRKRPPISTKPPSKKKLKSAPKSMKVYINNRGICAKVPVFPDTYDIRFSLAAQKVVEPVQLDGDHA
jgi:hypothetical protein